MRLWVAIEELRQAVNVDAFTITQRDEELIRYALSAQNHAEEFCRRKFDGLKKQTRYFDGDICTDLIQFPCVPLLAIDSLYDSELRTFDSSSLVASTDYFLNQEYGQVQRMDGTFNAGTRNIKAVFYGGYVGELALVDAALAANTMALVSGAQAKFRSQPFNCFVTTGTAQTAGSVTITGTDENGDAQTETITFTGTSPQRLPSKKTWLTVTAFSAASIQGAGATGTVTLTASSFPEALRTAILMHATHMYLQDKQRTINVKNRSIDTESEGGFSAEVPKEVIQLLNNFRDAII